MNGVEKLIVWNKSIKLAKEIYNYTNNNDKISKDFWLRDQIQRSAVSIGSNIAEWYDRWSSKEYIRFLYIAKWSCSELKTQIFIASEIWYIDNDDKKTNLIHRRNSQNVKRNNHNFKKETKTLVPNL